MPPSGRGSIGALAGIVSLRRIPGLVSWGRLYMRNAISSRLTALAILACGFLAVSEAQEFRAKLQGVVTDSSTSVVVGATVTLTNTKTGVEVVRTTNETGRYRFDF